MLLFRLILINTNEYSNPDINLNYYAMLTTCLPTQGLIYIYTRSKNFVPIYTKIARRSMKLGTIKVTHIERSAES